MTVYPCTGSPLWQCALMAVWRHAKVSSNDDAMKRRRQHEQAALLQRQQAEQQQSQRARRQEVTLGCLSPLSAASRLSQLVLN